MRDDKPIVFGTDMGTEPATVVYCHFDQGQVTFHPVPTIPAGLEHTISEGRLYIHRQHEQFMADLTAETLRKA